MGYIILYSFNFMFGINLPHHILPLSEQKSTNNECPNNLAFLSKNLKTFSDNFLMFFHESMEVFVILRLF